MRIAAQAVVVRYRVLLNILHYIEVSAARFLPETRIPNPDPFL